MRDDVAESRCRVFDIGMQGVVVPDNIGVGGNQFLRYRDSLENGLSNSEVRKVPWVHGRASKPAGPNYSHGACIRRTGWWAMLRNTNADQSRITVALAYGDVSAVPHDRDSKVPSNA